MAGNGMYLIAVTHTVLTVWTLILSLLKRQPSWRNLANNRNDSYCSMPSPLFYLLTANSFCFPTKETTHYSLIKLVPVNRWQRRSSSSMHNNSSYLYIVSTIVNLFTLHLTNAYGCFGISLPPLFA